MHIGDEVICLVDYDDEIKDEYPGKEFPEYGKKYHVRKFSDRVPNALYLEEIVNLPEDYQNGYMELCFDTSFFRVNKPDLSPAMPKANPPFSVLKDIAPDEKAEKAEAAQAPVAASPKVVKSTAKAPTAGSPKKPARKKETPKSIV